MDDQTLEDRLRSVERAVTDDDADPVGARNYDDRLSDIEARLRELEAATQALRGYVGDVRQRDDRDPTPTDADLSEVKRFDGGDTRHPIDDTHPPDVPGEETDGGLLDRLDKWL